MTLLKDLKGGQFDYLVHSVRDLDDLISILRTWYLLTSVEKRIQKTLLDFKKLNLGVEQKYADNYPGVYMSLSIFDKNPDDEYDMQMIYGPYKLIFSLNILHNQNNFHITHGHRFGMFEDTFYPEEYYELKSFVKFPYRDGERRIPPVEVVFHDKVSLNYLRYIIIDFENAREDLITRLKREKMEKIIPLIFTTKDLRKHRKLIDTPRVSRESKDPTFSSSQRRRREERCIPFDFDIKEIEKINDPKRRKFILKLINQCGIHDQLPDLNKKRFTAKDVNIIKDAVMNQYTQYMKEKYDYM